MGQLATELAPLLADPRVGRECTAFAARVAGLAADMPLAGSDLPAPSSGQAATIAAALDTYGRTSPQMVVFGTLLEAALPRPRR